MPYVAYHVNLLGAAEAAYELQAKDDEAAKEEARQFLRQHPSVEVWDGSRWVARFVREEAPRIRGH